MKQYITVEQWEEITDDQKRILKDLVTKSGDSQENNKYARSLGMATVYWIDHRSIDIGIMIEYLDKGGIEIDEDGSMKHYEEDWHYVRLECIHGSWEGELCDKLWEDVKEKLNTL